MKVIVHEGLWTREDTLLNPRSLYIFGDNDARTGTKGQAVIRFSSNAMGIPTKKYPSMYDSSFYTDNEIEQNKQKIDMAIDAIITRLKGGENFLAIVLPSKGLGTGLAQLEERAPVTAAYLRQAIRGLENRVKEL